MICAGPVLATNVDRGAVVASINTLRATKNLTGLQYSTKLEKVARRHAEDMARNGFFSHTGSDGSGIGTRLIRSGYGWCTAAENIASGQRTLAEVMRSWSRSPGHRKNMLNKKISEFALVQTSDKIWVMVLAQPGC
ncbi:MAG: serine protease [Rhodobacteraceae bacterium]|nr:MAG: serine protease [Paracoccaceae bacterium]